MRILGVLALLSAATMATAADRPWVEARSARFAVVTNGSEADARSTLRQFEQIHAVFRTATGGASSQDVGKPFTILAARDEDTMKRLLPAYWEKKDSMKPAGVFFDDPTQVFVVVRTGDRPTADYGHSIVFHEYVHFMIARNVDFLPLWLNEGLAEFYATSSVERDRVMVGRAAPWNLQLLQGQAMIPMETLLAVDGTSPLYNEQNRSTVFYGQSWALVHYLINGEGGRQQPRMAAYLDRIDKGEGPVEAGRQAFGDLNALAKQIQNYVRGYQFFMRPIATTEVPAEKSFATRTVPPAEVLALQAALHAVTGRAAEAAPEAEEAVRLDPQLSLGWQASARLHMDAGRYDEAARAAGEALRAEPGSALAHHLAGQVALRRGDSEAAEKELARAVEINDALAVSHVMLAVVRHHLDRPNQQVVPHVRRALTLEPGNPMFQVMLASVLRDRGDSANARRLSDRALRMARSAEERAHVQQAVTEGERYAAQRQKAIAEGARLGAVRAATPDGEPPEPGGPGSASPAPRRSPLTVDDATAFKLYRASCEGGEPRGCAAAGEALQLGRGVARDTKQAAAYYAKACDGDVATSCHELAGMHLTGDGVPRDAARARALFARACKAGYAPACKRVN